MRPSAKWCRRLSERYAPKQGRRGVVHLRNYSTEYLIAGEGHPLVLVPGLAGGFELLGRLVRVLARRFRVICYQLRGEQDPVTVRRGCGLGDLADDLADLQSALLLERPTVVGVSFGSAVALEFALRHGSNIDHVVLHGMAARIEDGVGGRIARLALQEFPLPHNNPFFNQFFRLLFARREAVGALFDYVTSQCWQTDQSVIAQRLGLLADYDVRARLSELRMQALVIAGEEDAIVCPASQRSFAERLPHGRYCGLPGAGHLCFLTRPNAFSRAMAAFLAAAPARAFA